MKNRFGCIYACEALLPKKKELTKLCNDNSLSISDELLLPSDTFTFVSSSHASTSWLDHVLSTSTGHALVQSIHVKSDYVTSDHLPLFSLYVLVKQLYVLLLLFAALLMKYIHLIGQM